MHGLESGAETRLRDRLANYLLRDVVGSMVPLIYPPLCGLCNEPVPRSTSGTRGNHHRLFCVSCETSLSQTGSAMRRACLRCGWPANVLGGDANPRVAPENLPCPNCVTMPPPSFAGIFALYRYQDTVCDAIVAAKFTRHACITRELGRRLGRQCLVRQDDEPDIPHWNAVTNVPGRRWRLIRRGGSGTAILAQTVAREVGTVYRPLVRCTRHISKQAWLDDAGRFENVRGAFAPSRRLMRKGNELAGANVLLVDDVFTTGATAGEVSRVLIEAGAKSVWVAVIARTIRDRSQ